MSLADILSGASSGVLGAAQTQYGIGEQQRQQQQQAAQYGMQQAALSFNPNNPDPGNLAAYAQAKQSLSNAMQPQRTALGDLLNPGYQSPDVTYHAPDVSSVAQMPHLSYLSTGVAPSMNGGAAPAGSMPAMDWRARDINLQIPGANRQIDANSAQAVTSGQVDPALQAAYASRMLGIEQAKAEIAKTLGDASQHGGTNAARLNQQFPLLGGIFQAPTISGRGFLNTGTNQTYDPGAASAQSVESVRAAADRYKAEQEKAGRLGAASTTAGATVESAKIHSGATTAAAGIAAKARLNIVGTDADGHPIFTPQATSKASLHNAQVLNAISRSPLGQKTRLEMMGKPDPSAEAKRNAMYLRLGGTFDDSAAQPSDPNPAPSASPGASGVPAPYAGYNPALGF